MECGSLLPLFPASLLALSHFASPEPGGFLPAKRFALSVERRPSYSAPAGWLGRATAGCSTPRPSARSPFYTTEQPCHPVETIRKNWKAAFETATWLDGVTGMGIPTGEAFEQHLAIVHRLNPKALGIENAATLRDLSALKPLSRLKAVAIIGCTGLTNVDGLKNLSALKEVRLIGCTGLTSVDALKNLSALQKVLLYGCTGLTNVDALKNLSALQEVSLNRCTGLTNVDGLKNLSALQSVILYGCTGLTNVDALMSLSALKEVYLKGCTGLTKESVAELEAALPDATVIGP